MTEEPDSAVRSIANQTADLSHIHDHSTRVIKNLDIPRDGFSDQYDSQNRADYPFSGIVKMFLYQHARGLNQSELERRLRGATYVYLRFGLPSPPTQGTISYLWRNRFSRGDRDRIKQAAHHIHTICAYRGLVYSDEPALNVDDLTGEDSLREEQIMEAIERASEPVLSKFDTKRAENAKYDDEVFFERQAYLNVSDAGTTTERRRFARLSHRDEIPHGRTHLRTLKKAASPDPQTELDAFRRGDREPDWKRIRDEVLEPFHEGIGEVLEEARTRKDSAGVREPVVAAIDVTEWGFYASPMRDHGERQPEDHHVEQDDEWRYVRHDYPEMASGSYKSEFPYSFKFATMTIIAGDTPFILAIEPVRDGPDWKSDRTTTHKGDVVDRLLEQATEHVDIHKVFLDREFDTYESMDAIDRRDITYLIPKTRYEKEYEGIEKVESHPASDVGVERDVPMTTDSGRTHTTSIMYVPSRKKDGQYAVFVTNRDMSPDRIRGFCQQYRQRWEIENQYKAIKAHFLPRCASLDYRIRFLYFLLGCVMHNVWRLANYFVREAVSDDVNLGETPPIPAGEIVEVLGFCIDPGG
jgi:hypothetical protein